MIQKLNEVAPPGWGHTKAEKEKTKPNKPKSKIGGTAHAMQKAQKRGDIPKNMNIFALMWSMKNKGDKPHYKPGVKGKLKGKYKGPEGQNEMIDPKKIRNYKNVPNSVVAKADKEAEKVKDKEQKGTLEFPQMPTEESTWSKNFKKQSSKRRGETNRRREAERDSPGQRVPPKTKNYGEDIDMVSLVAQAIKSLPEGEWADSKAQEKKDSDRLIAIQNEREKRYQAQQAAKKQAAAKKEEVEIDELTQAEYDSGGLVRKHLDRKQASGTSRETENKIAHNKRVQMRKRLEKAADERDKKEGIEGDALVKAVANSSKQQALKKKQMLGITPAGKKALKKGDHKLSITPKGKAAVEDMSLAPKGKGRKAAKALYKENEVTHFGDVLRQAIEEAKKVNAIDTINKIVKTKTMGKLHGQKVDLFTASAIQQVYKAINHKNKEKMNSVMSKDIHGLLKMADFSMSKMKR